MPKRKRKEVVTRTDVVATETCVKVSRILLVNYRTAMIFFFFFVKSIVHLFPGLFLAFQSPLLSENLLLLE